MKRRRYIPGKNPVALAVGRKILGAHLRDLSIKAFLTEDGARDRDLIAQFVFLIGIGAEVCLHVDPRSSLFRRLHGALRSLMAMSVDGGIWRASQVGVLYELAKQSQELFIVHVEIGMQVYNGASALAERARAGVATMADVVGAEIYRDEEVFA